MLGLAILLSLLVIPSIFAETNATLTFESKDYNVNINEEFNVTIVLNTSVALGSLDFNVTWDPNYLEYISYTNGEAVKDSMATINDINASNGYLHAGYISISGINSGKVLILTFKAKNVGDTIVTLNVEDVSDTFGNQNISINPSNSSMIYIEQSPKPDLTITDLQIPTNPIVNNTYTINATIKNIGTKEASSFDVVLKDNGNDVEIKQIPSLNSNENTIVSFTWKPSTEGLHNLTVIVDNNNQIDELNEQNNIMTKLAYVQPIPIHDVAVISINAQNVKMSQPIIITANITNNGNQNETNVNVSLYANNNYINSSLINLSVGESKAVVFKYIPETFGNIALKIKATITNDINLSNNEKETIVYVEPLPDLTITQLTTKDLYYQTNGTITVTIKNIGYKEINEPFNLTLNISGNIQTKTINNLSINEEKTLTFYYKPNTTGKITITAIVDSTNNIDEINKSNNIITKEINVIELPVFITIKTTKSFHTAVINKTLKEGESVVCGDYEVKIKAIFTSLDKSKKFAIVQILKDGKVVKEKRIDLNESNPGEVITDDDKVAVLGFKGLKNIAGSKGYAEVIVVKNLMSLEAGEEYTKDWEIRWINTSGNLQKGDVDKDTIAGIALVYTKDIESDDLKDKDDKADIGVYPGLYIKRTTAKDEDPELRIGAELSEEKTLSVGSSVSIFNADIKLKEIKATAAVPVKLTAPIAKLDTEVSLDTADKNLVLVGGPVANKLTKELVDAGKISLDNNSPATIAVLKGEANGHDVVVVAGGDREKTREAALELLKML